MGDAITTVARVERLLPDPVSKLQSLSPPVTSATVFSTIEEYVDVAQAAISPKQLSSASGLDREIVAVWTAITVRHEIPRLSEDEGSRTDSLKDILSMLLQERITSEDSYSEFSLPVGPDGREGVGLASHVIFRAPGRRSDDWGGLYATDPDPET
jgi:hypothetical protein